MNHAGQIVRQSFIYATGNVLRGLASFIMLPVYTTYLSPADYGVIELIAIVLDLTLLLLGARVAVGIFKFYSDANTQREKNEVVSTALLLMAGVHLVAVLVVVIFNGMIAKLLNVTPDFGVALAVYSVSAVFAAMNEVFFAHLKIQDRAYLFVGINLGKLILQLTLNIILIAYLNLNYWGVIWSAVISSAVTTIFFFFFTVPSIGMRFSKAVAKLLTHFSAPIILASLAMYYVTFSSRYYLQYLNDTTAVGIYALANKFGLLIFVLVASPFSEYWNARQFDMAKTAGSDRLFGQVFFYLSLIMFAASAGLIATVTDFVHLSATKPYWPALAVIPWLVGAYVMQAWGDYFRFGCFYTSNNRFITYSSIVMVVVITGFYTYWIPREGAVGAGKAMFVTSCIRFAMLYYFGQRLFVITVPWLRLSLCLVAFALVLIPVSLIELPPVAGIFAKGSVIVVATLVILASPLIEREHRTAFIKGVTARFASRA